jgi:hypothetical protein
MQRPLTVTFHNSQRSEAVEAKIRDYVTRLERYCDHILGCHVTIDIPHRSSSLGNPYHSILQFFAICRKILSWYTIARIGNVSQCSITVYQNLC